MRVDAPGAHQTWITNDIVELTTDDRSSQVHRGLMCRAFEHGSLPFINTERILNLVVKFRYL